MTKKLRVEIRVYPDRGGMAVHYDISIPLSKPVSPLGTKKFETYGTEYFLESRAAEEFVQALIRSFRGIIPEHHLHIQVTKKQR